MTAVLVSHRCNARYGTDFVAAAARDGAELELLVLPGNPEARIDDAVAARAEAAYYSGDVFPGFSKQFFSATRKASGATGDIQYPLAGLQLKQSFGGWLDKVILEIVAIADLIVPIFSEVVPDISSLSIIFRKIRRLFC